MARKQLNGDQPATEYDLSLLGGQPTNRIDKVETKIDKVEKKLSGDINSLRRVVNAIFKVVKSIEGQVGALRDIPERVARLERDVFDLKLKARHGKP